MLNPTLTLNHNLTRSYSPASPIHSLESRGTYRCSFPIAWTRGGSRNLKKGGHSDTFFSDRRQPRKSRKSPKKLMGGGNSDTSFFGTAASLESRASPKKLMSGGGGGGGLRHMCYFFFRFQKGGHRPDVPPSKSATGLNPPIRKKIPIPLSWESVAIGFYP